MTTQVAEYKGKEFIIAAKIPDQTGTAVLVRPFNQTSGSHSVEADEIELDTKDKTGSDYGKVTETRSFEGIFTSGDPFPAAAIKLMREKKMIEVYEIDTRTKKAEKGMYMITSFEKSHENGDFVTYSVELKLNGETTEETLTTIPVGAQ